MMEVNDKSGQLSLSQLLFASDSVDRSIPNSKVIEQLASMPSQDESYFDCSLTPEQAAFPDEWKGELVRIKQESRKWRQEVYSTFVQFKSHQPTKSTSKLSSKQARTASLLDLLTKVNKDYDTLVKSIAQSELRIQEKEQTNAELKHTLDRLQSKLFKLQNKESEAPGCTSTCQIY
mmetsp:Transcript_18762/g.34017  ORF Transcript_18762/g.34017 Transcript_18762/m.34017 type:complete len:176 (+) Transcript_18762:278-805(+)